MICLRSGPIAHLVNSLEVGQAVRVDRREFEREFSPGPFREGTAIDTFLSSCVGSGYGTVRVEVRTLDGEITISRHNEDPRCGPMAYRWHVDADRQHLYWREGDRWMLR